jgi:replicative DNA helicase
MRNSYENLLGVLLNVDLIKQQNIMSRLDPKWFKHTKYQTYFEGVDHCVKNGGVDIVRLATYFKEKGKFDSNLIKDISRIGSIDYNFNLVSIDTLVSDVFSEYGYQCAIATTNAIKNLIVNEQFNLKQYRDILKRGDTGELITNESKPLKESVRVIIDDHARAREGILGGIEIGYKALRGVVLLEPVDVMIVGARPAMGKTAFAVNTVVQLAKEGKNVVLFALEMSKEQMLRRILANITEVDSMKLKYGHCTDAELVKVLNVEKSDILDRIHLIDGSQTIGSITTAVSTLNNKHKIDLIVIDYLQKIQPMSTRSRYESVSEISNGVKLISQNMKIPIMALAQLSRDSSKLAKRPSLPDIRESGEIEQDASVVAFLHRPEYYGDKTTYSGQDSKNICEFIVAKNREGELGIFEMEINLKTSKYV